MCCSLWLRVKWNRVRRAKRIKQSYWKLLITAWVYYKYQHIVKQNSFTFHEIQKFRNQEIYLVSQEVYQGTC